MGASAGYGPIASKMASWSSLPAFPRGSRVAPVQVHVKGGSCGWSHAEPRLINKAARVGARRRHRHTRRQVARVQRSAR